MNVGYSGILCDWEEVNKKSCPICGSDIYVGKLGLDYKCVNKDCPLNRRASVLVKEIESVLAPVKNKGAK
jgi:hypothetical protein